MPKKGKQKNQNFLCILENFPYILNCKIAKEGVKIKKTSENEIFLKFSKIKTLFLIQPKLLGVVPHQIALFLFCIEFGWGWTKLIIVLCQNFGRGVGGWVWVKKKFIG